MDSGRDLGAREHDKSSFRGQTRNLAFRREFRVSAGFRAWFAGFGISKMRCRARAPGMFIAKFYYPGISTYTDAHNFI